MTTVEFIFVADRGMLKVYVIDRFLRRGPALRLTKILPIEEVLEQDADRFTDRAGVFPNTGSGYANAVAERPALKEETQNRGLRGIAASLTDVLDRSRPRQWSFAAPAEINEAILSFVPAPWHRHLRRNLKKDFVNVPPEEILPYFEK